MGGGEIVALENVEHFDERDTAGARRRHRDDFVAAVATANRSALLCLVLRQILGGDETATTLHLLGEESRGFAEVEAVASFIADAGEGASQIGLTNALAGDVRLT